MSESEVNKSTGQEKDFHGHIESIDLLKTISRHSKPAANDVTATKHSPPASFSDVTRSKRRLPSGNDTIKTGILKHSPASDVIKCDTVNVNQPPLPRKTSACEVAHARISKYSPARDARRLRRLVLVLDASDEDYDDAANDYDNRERDEASWLFDDNDDIMISSRETRPTTPLTFRDTTDRVGGSQSRLCRSKCTSAYDVMSKCRSNTVDENTNSNTDIHSDSGPSNSTNNRTVSRTINDSNKRISQEHGVADSTSRTGCDMIPATSASSQLTVTFSVSPDETLILGHGDKDAPTAASVPNDITNVTALNAGQMVDVRAIAREFEQDRKEVRKNMDGRQSSSCCVSSLESRTDSACEVMTTSGYDVGTTCRHDVSTSSHDSFTTSSRDVCRALCHDIKATPRHDLNVTFRQDFVAAPYSDVSDLSHHPSSPVPWMEMEPASHDNSRLDFISLDAQHCDVKHRTRDEPWRRRPMTQQSKRWSFFLPFGCCCRTKPPTSRNFENKLMTPSQRHRSASPCHCRHICPRCQQLVNSNDGNSRRDGGEMGIRVGREEEGEGRGRVEITGGGEGGAEGGRGIGGKAGQGRQEGKLGGEKKTTSDDEQYSPRLQTSLGRFSIRTCSSRNCCEPSSFSTSGWECSAVPSGTLLSPDEDDEVIAPPPGGAWKRRRRVLYPFQRVLFIVCAFIGVVISLTGIAVGISLLKISSGNNASSSAASLTASSLSSSPSSSSSSSKSSFIDKKGTTAEFLSLATYETNQPIIRDSSGWVNLSLGSAHGSRYTVVNKVLTFYAAQDECNQLGGHLVRVNSIREQIFLEDFLRQELDIEGVAAGAVGFWIGARRARGSHGDTCMFDQWKWTDAYGRAHGVISGFTAFIPGKPDNYYNPEECLFMSFRDNESEERFLKWDDAPCDLNSVGGIKAICEVEVSS